MRFRAVSAWLTLSAYSLALIGAYALHPPHVGDCSSGHCCFPGHDSGSFAFRHCEHPGHALVHDHDEPSDGHSPAAPVHDEDDCAWCQFLALAAWQGPAIAELPLAVPVGTLCVLVPRQCSPEAPTLHPARGPPAVFFAVVA